MGATELSEFAFAMETAGKDGNIDHLKSNHHKLMTEYRRYKELLKDVCDNENGSDNKDKPHADRGVLRDLLGTMRRASENFDYNMLEETFDTIREYSFDEDDRKIIKALENRMDMLEYDEMIKIIDESGVLETG